MSSKTSSLTAGQPAPVFEAQSTAGSVQMSDLQGQAVVIYFYPRDNTPGCTNEAQGFKEHWPAFQEQNCLIYGVSRDSMTAHTKFSNKLELPFALISDPDETVCNLFGVMRDKMMYGKQVRGIERSTFLIDAQGNVAKVWRGVKVPGHVEEVLQAVRDL